MDTLRQRVIKGSAWTIIGLGVSLPLGIVTNILVARSLGPGEFGRLAELLIVFTLVAVAADLGVGSAALQAGTSSETRGDHRFTRQLLGRIQSMRLLVTLPATLIALFLWFRHESPWIAALAAISLVLPIILAGFTQLLQFRNQSATMAKVGVATTVLTNVGAIAAALSGGDGAEVFTCRAVCALLLPIALLLLANPKDRRAALRPRLPSQWPEKFWRFAISTWVAVLVGTLVFSRSEVLALRYLDLPVAAGLFALAFAMSQQVTSPLDSLASVILGATTARYESHREGAARLMLQTTLFLSIALGPLILLGSLAPVIVPAVMGDGYRQAGGLFLALLIASSLQTLAHPVQAYLFASRAGTSLLLANVLALLVDVLLVVSLAPLWQAWAAVLANITAQLVSLGYSFAVSARTLSLSLRQVWETSRSLLLSWLLMLLPLAAYRAGGRSLIVGAMCILVAAFSIAAWLIVLRTRGWAQDLATVGLLEKSDSSAIQRRVISTTMRLFAVTSPHEVARTI